MNMQNNQIAIDQQKSQKQQNEENELTSMPPIQKVKKIKKSLLKLKKIHVSIPHFLNIQCIYRIGDAIIANQESLRDPEHCSTSYFGAIFYFKRIQSLIIDKNLNFITFNLKRIPQSFLPAQYAVQRFKSFNDKTFNDMAQNIRSIHEEFQHIKLERIALRKNMKNYQNETQELQKIARKQEQDLKILTNYLKQNPSGLNVGIYYKESQMGLSINKLMISTKLLETMGIKLTKLIEEYANYKTICFEIFSSQYYKFIFSKIINSVSKTLSKSRKNQPFDYSQYYVASKGEILLKREVNGLEFQQKASANIVFQKLTRNASIFSISDIQQKQVIIACKNDIEHVERLKFDQVQDIKCQIQKMSHLHVGQNIIFCQSTDKQMIDQNC